MHGAGEVGELIVALACGAEFVGDVERGGGDQRVAAVACSEL